ncbi:hypothetical protein HDR59_02470 [bacterium]|nr:hypothetical protein [bacterium]
MQQVKLKNIYRKDSIISAPPTMWGAGRPLADLNNKHNLSTSSKFCKKLTVALPYPALREGDNQQGGNVEGINLTSKERRDENATINKTK